MRAFAVLAMIAACFDKPPRPELPNDGALGDGPHFDGTRDGSIGPMACTGGAQAILFEEFDEGDVTGAAACNAAGSVTGPSGTLVRQGGLLTFTGTAGVGTSAYCIWNTLPIQNGVILKWAVLDSLQGGDTAAMTATWTQSASRTTGIVFGQGSGGFNVFFTSDGTTKSMTLTSQLDTWWRVMPSATAMTGEVSTDPPSSWSPVGADPGSPPITVAGLQIDFAAVDGNQVKLDAIYLCP
jgi:hypothetical protein